MNHREDRSDGPFVCVEPALGKQRGSLADPDLEPSLRRELEEHVAICDACRLELAIAARISGEVRAGRLLLSGIHGRRRSRTLRLLAWAGGLAAAASVALVFLLPPSPAGPDSLRRSDPAAPHFLRPVEGEVLISGTPELSWTRVEGATSYRVLISRPDGEEVWNVTVPSTSVRLPEDVLAPDPARYRVVVEPVPVDLAGMTELNVSFRRDGVGAFVSYRLQEAPAVAWWLGIIGLLALGIGVAGIWYQMRPPRH